MATADLLVVEIDEEEEGGIIDDFERPGTLNADTVEDGLDAEMTAAANKKYRRVWLEIILFDRNVEVEILYDKIMAQIGQLCVIVEVAVGCLYHRTKFL